MHILKNSIGNVIAEKKTMLELRMEAIKIDRHMKSDYGSGGISKYYNPSVEEVLKRRGWTITN